MKRSEYKTVYVDDQEIERWLDGFDPSDIDWDATIEEWTDIVVEETRKRYPNATVEVGNPGTLPSCYLHDPYRETTCYDVLSEVEPIYGRQEQQQ